jgi:hypothetical protein
MKLLTTTFPTKSDISELAAAIQTLSQRADSLQPQLREMFHAQITSASNQFYIVRKELEAPRAATTTSKLERLIMQRWERLKATLAIAEAYCS